MYPFLRRFTELPRIRDSNFCGFKTGPQSGSRKTCHGFLALRGLVLRYLDQGGSIGAAFPIGLAMMTIASVITNVGIVLWQCIPTSAISQFLNFYISLFPVHRDKPAGWIE